MYQEYQYVNSAIQCMILYLDIVNDIHFLIALLLKVQLYSQWELTPAPPRQVKGTLTETITNLVDKM